MRTIALALAITLGVLGIGNGIYMLVAPEDWYLAVPGVTDTGPFNQHFVRDIGLIFLLLGGAFLLGAAQPVMRLTLWTAATAWLCGHALFHFWEVAVGICTPDVLPRDFPAVTLPALIGIGLSVWAYRQRRVIVPA